MKSCFVVYALLLGASFPSSAADAEKYIPFYRKVSINADKTGDLPKHLFPDSEMKADSDGVERFKFEVSVSDVGKVLSVKQISGPDNPINANKLIDRVQRYVYDPQIYNYKPVPSQIIEEEWIIRDDAEPTYPSYFSCTDEVSPTTFKQKEIIYPVSLNQKLIKGSAKIAFSVSPDGKAFDIEAIEYDHELFARHAAISLREWQFRPAKFKGKYASCRGMIVVDYMY